MPRIVTFDRSTPDREAGARQQVADTGATFVHPFEDPLVMSGQGTTALELHEQVGPLDVLLVPMSGGGLMAGCALGDASTRPHAASCIGVEPANADDTRRSFAAGKRVTIAPALDDRRRAGRHLARTGDVRDQSSSGRRRGHRDRRRDHRRDAQPPTNCSADDSNRAASSVSPQCSSIPPASPAGASASCCPAGTSTPTPLLGSRNADANGTAAATGRVR